MRRAGIGTSLSMVFTVLAAAGCGAVPGATGPAETLPGGPSAAPATQPLEPTGGGGPTDGVAPTDYVYPTTDIGNGRPSTVTVTIAGNVSGANGTYTATGTTRACGNLFMDPDAFIYEFPFEGEHNPNNVSFAATPLRPGESTAKFHVDIGITTDQITPSIIGDPGGTAGDAGTATRTDEGGTTKLVLHATNNRNESIDLTATCGPRP